MSGVRYTFLSHTYTLLTFNYVKDMGVEVLTLQAHPRATLSEVSIIVPRVDHNKLIIIMI